MTFASKITVARLLLVPVFAYLTLHYDHLRELSQPDERWRIAALWVFIIAAASDALDGYIARKFNQHSEFGAFIDPIADKTLLLTGLCLLTWVDWGASGWRLPLWFFLLIIARDALILGGIGYLWHRGKSVKIAPHWSGKVCTVTQMIALGCVMLSLSPIPPLYPCALAAIFTIWSGVAYFRTGLAILLDKK